MSVFHKKGWMCFGLVVTMISMAWAQPEIVFSKQGEVWEEQDETGLQQMYDALNQLKEAVSELPPTVERVAIHQFNVDRKYFDKGMARFFKTQIEDVFRKDGRRELISAPELKTTRIISTDTSFSMSNAIPDAEALWVIGRKLRIDAFIQGAITRSAAGDLLLSVKLIKQATAEILWSGTFIAGPNKKVSRDPSFKYGLAGGFGYWPVTRYKSTDTLITQGISVYNYYIEGVASEYITDNRRLMLSLNLAMGFYVPVLEDPSDEELNKIGWRYNISGGADFILILLKKPAEVEGYYLGMYAGAKTIFPHNFLLMNAGYMMQATPHLGVSVGGNYYPLHNKFEAGTLNLNDYVLEMEALSYEAKIYYFF